MKTFITLLLVLSTAASLSAQIQKGTVLLGGTFGFNNVRTEDYKTLVVNISPTVGYCFSPRFALGGSLDINLLEKSDGASRSIFGIAPFVRGYVNEKGNARFYVQVEAGIQSEKLQYSNGLSSLLFGIGLGADFSLNKNVAIEWVLGYTRSEYIETVYFGSNSPTNTIGMNFGIVAILNKKKI